jgi:hypothetical protein
MCGQQTFFRFLNVPSFARKSWGLCPHEIFYCEIFFKKRTLKNEALARLGGQNQHIALHRGFSKIYYTIEKNSEESDGNLVYNNSKSSSLSIINFCSASMESLSLLSLLLILLLLLLILLILLLLLYY